MREPYAWLQGIKVYEWEDFNKLGKSKPTAPVPPKADDPATIMYTSGTTGAHVSCLKFKSQTAAVQMGFISLCKQ